jgi:NAD(P)H dehydrogenase (quinone)
MKVLIIYAHPRNNSFNKAILDRIEGVLTELQQEVVVRDLYALSFNPAFSAEDQVLISNGIMPEDVKVEQDYIAWAEYIIVIHPIWWMGMPAIMKGYIDRVLVSGFAYKYDNGELIGLLEDKKLLLINTTGTSDKIMERNGIKKVLQTTIDNGVYGFCGLDVEHLYLPAVPYVKKSVREEYLDEVENTLWQELN